ncbi:pyridoxal-phosphate dependent enzyme [Streptomyces olivaceoviridis]|uniref:pyridoxal-phosphate dependent enzyme n=1 Tax=Streptomyces olivaceoviridis TaxID=1921 RepID=UPI0037026F06
MTAAHVTRAGLDARTDTPLRGVALHGARTHRFWIKLEAHNPSGSVKYRTAVGLLAALHARAPLRPGTTVVESTSGNLGVALAHLLRERQCRFIAVVDPKLPPRTRELLLRAGAVLVETDTADAHGGYLQARLERVREICAADPTIRWTNQYANPMNPQVHESCTAAEIAEQTAGRVDAVFAAVSTGGTLTGLHRGLRDAGLRVRAYAVDVQGSSATPGPRHSHLLTGIGASRRSHFLTEEHLTEAIRVADIDAFAYCRLLREDTGLAVGGSTGAVLAAFAEVAGRAAAAPAHPVLISADGSDNYENTFYDDHWLAGHGVLNRVRDRMRAVRRAGGALSLADDK